MKKNILFIVLMLLTLVANAEEVKINGLWYNLDASTNTAEVIRYKNNLKYSGDIVIPETVTYGTSEYSVTSIGNWAFNSCSGLTSVEIPSSVTSIGDYVFQYCSGLTSVEIPSSISSIGAVAFCGCSGLTSIEIPSSVTSLGNATFSGCSSLTSISVDASNAAYDSRNNCNAIIEKSSNTLIAGCMNTVIPSSVTTIGNSAFRGCSSLKIIDIPSSVTNINGVAFAECSSLTSISIPNSVTEIGEAVFSECTGLITITLPNSLNIISSSLFEACSSLSDITIPEGVTAIHDLAFGGCSSLSSITLPEGVRIIYDYAFNGCTSLSSIILPEGLTTIGPGAFVECSQLSSISFPQSLEEIEGSAFEGTKWLESQANGVIYAGPILYTYKGTVPYNTKLVIKEGTSSIAGWAFGYLDDYKKRQLVSVTFPESLKKIGYGAFMSCSGLTNIIIPDGITHISGSAFESCTNLAKLTLGQNVSILEEGAFLDTPNLTEITVKNINPISINESVFDNYDATLIVPDGSLEAYRSADVWKNFATFIEEKYIAFSDDNTKQICISNWDTDGDGELSEREAAAVTSLGTVFYGNKSITSFNELEYFTSLTIIPNNAFFNCSNLTSISIPEGVKSIGDGAFYDCI